MKKSKRHTLDGVSENTSPFDGNETEEVVFANDKRAKSHGFIKNYGIIIFPAILLLIVCVILMTCLVGIRGVYVNVDDPNEFFNFSAGTYAYVGFYGDLVDYSDAEKGIWQPSDKKMKPVGVDRLYMLANTRFQITRVDKDCENITVREYGGDCNLDVSKKFRRVSLISYPLLTKKVTVRFDVNGGDQDLGYTKKIKMGGTVDYPDFIPTKQGYEFKGWFTDPYGFKRENGQVFYNRHRIWQNTTVYANWYNGTEYEAILDGTNFSFRAQEGDLLLPALQKGEDILTYDYYLDGKLIDENTVMPPKNVKITKQNQRERAVHVYYDANGGEFPVKEQVITESYGKPIGSQPTKEGYVFGGWQCDDRIIYLDGKTSTGICTSSDRKDKYLKAIWLEPFSFVLKNGGYELAKCNALEWNFIVIPSSYNGLPVTSIGEYAFSSEESAVGKYKYIDVTIPSTVTSIGKSAFKQSLFLKTVRIPDSVTEIGADAFYECASLTTVYIPASLRKLPAGLLGNCAKLSTINFKGNKSKWTAIEKDEGWIGGFAFGLRPYTVVCLDGNIENK